MLFKWLNAREATEVGTALADDVVLQSAPGSSDQPRHEGRGGTQGRELQKFLQKFLQRVDREARPLKLNLFKRAKLANAFKWRLLEKGVQQQMVDELTQALVLRLTADRGTTPSGPAAPGSKRRVSAREVVAIHTRAHQAMERRAYAEALEDYQELIALDPRDAVAHSGLGAALAQMGRYGLAEQQFRRAIGIKPGFVEAHFNLAGVLRSLGRYQESEMSLRRALKLKPAYLDAKVSLGTSLLLGHRLQEARQCYEMALRSAPRNTQALVGLGHLESLEGNFTEAETVLRRALEVDPADSYAWGGLASLRKMSPADGAWVKRAEEIAAGVLTPVEEATLRFAIGKYYDDVGDYGRAFRAYQRANELHKMRAQPYDREQRTRFADDLIRVYTREALAAAAAGASDSARPVFVVGMPRSGTTLAEQIIASHPSARGAGELDFWPFAIRRNADTLREQTPSAALGGKLATAYLRVLQEHAPDVPRVVDKSPFNSDHLGIIHLVFPRARVIYMRRDPIDTCLSCHFQQFSPTVNFTMDLDDLAHYYREHHRLIEHWRRVLPPGTLLDVPYAELIADQEGWSRRIVEFLGLEWDERCLDFHRTRRQVITASNWQVRQKIYTSSLGRWRNYEKFIGPLRGLQALV